MKVIKWALLFVLSMASIGAYAQATGDTISRTEPTFPLTSTCDTYRATVYQAITNTVNLDPWNPTIQTAGTLNSTGGTSFEPSTSSGSYSAAETDDTGLQAVISATTKPCVEVLLGTLGQDALVLAPGFRPQTSTGAGIKLIVDGGVRLYISRNLSDFGGGSCGKWSDWPGTLSCPKWITPTASGVGIYGYGVLDGRVWSRYTGVTCPSGYSPCSPGTLKVLSYCLHTANAREWPPSGTGQIPCPTGTQTSNNNFVANGSNTLEFQQSPDTVLYKITLENAQQFNIDWVGPANNFLGWGIKFITSGEVSNTDGFDPAKGATNFSLYHSFCSVGDNCSAIKTNTSSSAGTQSANGTFYADQETAGIGWTIGFNSTVSSGIGVNNILYDLLVMNGGHAVNSSQQVGWGINGGSGQGGNVNDVTFEHTCSTNETITEQYIGGPGQMTNILETDTHILNGSLTGNSGELKYQGNNSSTLLEITLNSMIANGTLTSSNQYANIIIGAIGVGTSIYNRLTGTGVTRSANASPPPTTTPVPCTTSTWQPLIGELWFSEGTNNNIQSLRVATPASYLLNATLLPVSASPSVKESLFLNETGTQASPIAKVEFLDNGVPIAACSGTSAVQLIHGNMYASCPLTGVTAGTHVYTARYNASGTDTNYPTNFVWGNPGTSNQLVAVVTGGPPPTAAPTGLTVIQVGP